jgi:hypothetical protein
VRALGVVARDPSVEGGLCLVERRVAAVVLDEELGTHRLVEALHLAGRRR